MRTLCWANGLSLSFVILSWICPFGYAQATNEPNNEGIDSRLVSANTSFGFKLFSQLVKQDIGKNIFISPSSIAIALTMTHNGADGETKEAMAKTLELQGMSLEEVNQSNAALIAMLENPEPDVQLEIANSLWANKDITFKPDFMKRSENFYGAKVTNLDFGTPSVFAVINGWINEETHGKIDKVVDKVDISLDTVLFIINAVYFKGIWTVQFNKEQTEERDFILLDGNKKKVPMMMSQSKRFTFLRGEKFQAASLPYGSGRMSMYIFLPDSASSLEEFHQSLNTENWENWMSQFHQEEVVIVLPRFKLEYEIKLNDALKALGMGVAFGSGANFENMCSGGAFIDYVKHKTFVEVNEEGTEAAATTVVKMKKGGPTLYVNRPFFCAIRDNKTGAVLFMGSIVNPQ